MKAGVIAMVSGTRSLNAHALSVGKLRQRVTAGAAKRHTQRAKARPPPDGNRDRIHAKNGERIFFRRFPDLHRRGTAGRRRQPWRTASATPGDIAEDLLD